MSESLRDVIARGSKSFFLASLFFSRQVRDDCWLVYRWCRHCDDRVDHALDGATAEAELTEIRRETVLGFEGKSAEPVFRDFGRLCLERRVPLEHPLEVLKGFEKDARGFAYRAPEDVDEYSFQVAGVVGLIMTRIMGVSDRRADSHAKDLGIAMQLTNIARDVAEDFARGRVYLPGSWLEEARVDSSRLLDAEQRDSLFQVVSRLLRRADALYGSGRDGLCYLPFRSAVAVSVAAAVYSEIGRKILREGPSALDKRVHVTFLEKIKLAFVGVFRVLPISVRALSARWS
jgi:phytoene synthase